MDDHSNPSKTLVLLDELLNYGLTDSAFSRLHHFKEPEKISSHMKYCADLAAEEGIFRTNSNRLVQQRLDLILRLYKAGDFKSSASQVFEKLAEVSVVEYKNDPRPLAEQYTQLSGGGASAA